MPADQIIRTVASMRSFCAEHGIYVSGDGRVSADATAQLLGLAPGTLRNWRSNRTGPNFCRSGVGGGRVSYHLVAIAEWIEARHQHPD